MINILGVMQYDTCIANEQVNKKVKKVMSKRSWQGRSVRTTITIDRTLYKEAQKAMQALGFGTNFSGWIAEAARAQMAKQRRAIAVLRLQRNAVDGKKKAKA